ncbi:MAG: DNA-binding domain-containing protein [Pseudomonadota bacterium]
MTSLAEKQAGFMRAILDEDAPLPKGWGNSQAAGMSVYRGNYRSSLMDALENTFERTTRYVGEGPFKRAAAHHVITNPPASWTIEDAGAGMDASCAEVFGDNPEVAELARLEWEMLQVSTAPDCEPLSPAAFGEATAEFGDEDWMALRLETQPRAAAWVTPYNLMGMWNALADDGGEMPDLALDTSLGCIVWREGERPTFTLVDRQEADGFAAMQSGASYGELLGMMIGENADEAAVQGAAQCAGGMLGGWLNEGMIIGLRA